MARINRYAQDATPDKSDKLIGTDSSGGTRNYSLENVGAFLAQTNSLGVHSNIPYKYTNGDLLSGNIKDNNNDTVVGAFPTSNVSIRVSTFPNNGDKSVLTVINTFLKKEIVISQIQDQNIFAVYKVNTISQVGSTDFYDLGLTHLNSNNNSDGHGFVTGVYYNVTLYTGAQDKEYEQNFSTSDLSFVNGQFELDIPHNLGKFPTISVKLSTGDVAIVPHSHINKNNLKVFFSALNSGTVYAN
tara:strand:- start:451 stop:1179 length:729 start_codon:yes stop_codon:yes gene_type:complete